MARVQNRKGGMKLCAVIAGILRLLYLGETEFRLVPRVRGMQILGKSDLLYDGWAQQVTTTVTLWSTPVKGSLSCL